MDNTLNITVRHNPSKPTCRLKAHMENNWKSWTEETTDYNGGLLEIQKGINPKLVDVEINFVETTSGENIIVYRKHTPIFQLHGSKALQLNVLETFLIGEIKANGN